MKTTIDIPDALYRKAKIRAVESGRTLKQIVLDSLNRELGQEPDLKPGESFAERRKLLPGYEAALKAGAFSGGTDSSIMISEDRSSREDALF